MKEMGFLPESHNFFISIFGRKQLAAECGVVFFFFFFQGKFPNVIKHNLPTLKKPWLSLMC